MKTRAVMIELYGLKRPVCYRAKENIVGFCLLEVKINIILHLFIAHINLGRNKPLHGRSQLLTAPAAKMLECAISWFFTRNFTLDPRNVHSYGLGRQKLSLWKVCFKECIYSFKFCLPRKKMSLMVRQLINRKYGQGTGFVYFHVTHPTGNDSLFAPVRSCHDHFHCRAVLFFFFNLWS